MKYLILFGIINTVNATTEAPPVDFTKPQLYNHSSFPVVVYMYSNLLAANGSSRSVDENSILNSKNMGITIPPGASINWIAGARSVEVYYAAKDPSMADIQVTNSYIIRPSADKWTITKKLTTP
ncbi:hypothetical protein KBC04_02025 [Candidatus Babeliales bacterium]|nr:hypothetical protein [Candidatus Babeliales bacterium]MBP9843813.1 hypothetical protein [Candidatus Babeliales bacterium]